MIRPVLINVSGSGLERQFSVHCEIDFSDASKEDLVAAHLRSQSLRVVIQGRLRPLGNEKLAAMEAESLEAPIRFRFQDLVSGKRTVSVMEQRTTAYMGLGFPADLARRAAEISMSDPEAAAGLLMEFRSKKNGKK